MSKMFLHKFCQQGQNSMRKTHTFLELFKNTFSLRRLWSGGGSGTIVSIDVVAEVLKLANIGHADSTSRSSKGTGSYIS